MTSGSLAVVSSLEDARGFSTGYNVVLLTHSFPDDIETPVPLSLKLRRAAGFFGYDCVRCVEHLHPCRQYLCSQGLFSGRHRLRSVRGACRGEYR